MNTDTLIRMIRRKWRPGDTDSLPLDNGMGGVRDTRRNLLDLFSGVDFRAVLRLGLCVRIRAAIWLSSGLVPMGRPLLALWQCEPAFGLLT